MSSALIASVQDDAEGPNEGDQIAEQQAAPPPPSVTLDQLPGIILWASTRDDPVLSERPDRYRPYLYTPATGAIRQVHFPDEDLGSASAALSWDGTAALVNVGGPVGREIFMVDLTDQSPAVLVGDRLPPISFSQPDAYISLAWSPDGSQAWVGQTAPAGQFAISVRDGSVTPIPYVDVHSQPPAFSPDGQWIAFGHRGEGADVVSIHLTAADGSTTPTKLTADNLYESAPVWTPGGNSVAYVAFSDLWEVRVGSVADGTSQTIAQAPEGSMVTDLAVSPDSAWIAYSIFTPAYLNRWIQVVNLVDPSIRLVLPHDASSSDRVLGWVSGPTG